MQKTAHAFGVALRLLRTRRRLKQWEVAEKAGMTKAMLSSYETGKVTPTLQSLITLFEALDTDFFGFQDALEAVDRTDRILEEGRPSPGELAVARSEDEAPHHEDGHQLLEVLVLRLGGIEGQLERIATDIGLLARR
jgi:transcriptional regulator with XRE-family HTH domain